MHATHFSVRRALTNKVTAGTYFFFRREAVDRFLVFAAGFWAGFLAAFFLSGLAAFFARFAVRRHFYHHRRGERNRGLVEGQVGEAGRVKARKLAEVFQRALVDIHVHVDGAAIGVGDAVHSPSLRILPEHALVPAFGQQRLVLA